MTLVTWGNGCAPDTMSPLAISNTELLLTMLVAGVVMAAHGYAFLRVDRQLRRKGYQSPFRTLGMVLGYLTVMGVGWLYDAKDPASCWLCTIAAHPERFQMDLIAPHVWRFARNFVCATAPLVALLGFIAFVVPVRPRKGGQRRVIFPWRLVSRLFAVGAGFSVLIGVAGAACSGPVLAARGSLEFALRVGGLCLLFYSASRGLARRRDAARALPDARSAEPYVLYLRPFDAENRAFAMLRTRDCRRLGLPVHNGIQAWQRLTFEEYFVQAVSRGLGPLIALGNPHDYLPPLGASRSYLGDDDWRAAFCRLAAGSSCILMPPGSSANLRWELEFLRATGCLSKLFVLTSPVKPRWQSWAPWASRSRQRRWGAFVAELSSIGFTLNVGLADGCTLGFDAQCVAVVNGSAAATPDEYVAAIRAALRARGLTNLAAPAVRDEACERCDTSLDCEATVGVRQQL